MIVILTAALLSLQAAPATPPATETAAAAPAKPAENPNKKICVKEEITGSRLQSITTCRTRAEWDNLRHEYMQEVGRQQREQNSLQPGGG